MNSYIDRCVERLVRIPYPAVPHTADEFLRSHSRLKLAKKFLHRYLWLRLSGQRTREIKHIERGMRVLWLYTGKSNFGDAIMDLSGRALLRDAGVALELLTLAKLQPVFAEDDLFAKIYSSVDEIENHRYDAIILSEFNYQSISLKTKHFAKTPFACLFQYFFGPDRNQILFSFAAVNDVFKVGLSNDALTEIAKPYLVGREATSAAIENRLAGAFPDVAIAVGGIDARRSYEYWLDVLSRLEQTLPENARIGVAVLGSDNGHAVANQIARYAFQRIDVNSLVGQLSLLEAREVIARSRLFVGCDGGLMHVAHTTDTPSVTLFADREPPHLRLTQRCQSVSIHSKGAVSDIAPQEIVRAMVERLSATPQEQYVAGEAPLRAVRPAAKRVAE